MSITADTDCSYPKKISDTQKREKKVKFSHKISKERRRGKPYISATDDLVAGKMKKPNTFSNCTLGCSPLRLGAHLQLFCCRD
jgi:hypothetical protein